MCLYLASPICTSVSRTRLVTIKEIMFGPQQTIVVLCGTDED